MMLRSLIALGLLALLFGSASAAYLAPTATNAALGVVKCDGVSLNCGSGTAGSILTINSQSGSTYTLVTTDNTKEIDMTNATAPTTVTFPSATGAGFGAAYFVRVCALSQGTTLTQAGGSSSTFQNATTGSSATTFGLIPFSCADARSDGTNYLVRPTSRGLVFIPTGWISGTNPNNAHAVTTNFPLKILAIIGRTEAVVGAAATVAIAAAPNQTKCSNATSLSAGGSPATLNANSLDPSGGSTAPGNQSLGLTTTLIQSGSALCFQATGFTSSPIGVGDITIIATTTAPVLICTLAGSEVGTGNGGQSCTSLSEVVTGDTTGGGTPSWTLGGTGGTQMCRNGVCDTTTAGVDIMMILGGILYQHATSGTPHWYSWNAGAWAATGNTYTVLGGDPR